MFAQQDRVINHAAGSHGVSGIFMKYDISSLMVKVTEQHMPLWQFLVRLCGIIGGIFTTTGRPLEPEILLPLDSASFSFRHRLVAKSTECFSNSPGMLHGLVGFVVDLACCRFQVGAYSPLKVREGPATLCFVCSKSTWWPSNHYSPTSCFRRLLTTNTSMVKL